MTGRLRLTRVGSAALAASVMLAACGLVGNGDRVAQDIADRFVERVNTNNCDAASGFDIDDATWTAACHATVANVEDGGILPAPNLNATLDNEDRRNYAMLSGYRDVNGGAAMLDISLTGDGLLANDATIDGISSATTALVGEILFYEYDGLAGDTVEPDGKAVIQQVQSLLLAGNCDEIESLMAPPSVFPGTVKTAECESAAALYAAHPPAVGGEESWNSAVYSAVDIPQSDEAYGFTRAAGEDGDAFLDRVMEVIAPVNRKVSLRIEDPQLTIEAVLHEGQWYLLDINIVAETFAFQF